MMNLRNLTKFVALKIKVNFQTGERAGGINPRDPNLYTLAQNLEDGYEIRLVLDDRDIEQYRNVPGIEIIEGIDAIDQAILQLLPNDEQYHFARDDLLVQTSILAKHQDPNDPFYVHQIPDDLSQVDVLTDGVYINGEKILGVTASERLARRLGKTIPFTTTFGQLPSETKQRLLNLWLMKHGIKGINMVRRVKKLSEILGV